ncbi:VOC family protein [Streptomyces sp. NPDC032198]|uniref:VOC family protein n=1 Tax=Streptomyces sp. NPDC032198 TaxID=3155127 RepID=UPI0033F51D9C
MRQGAPVSEPTGARCAPAYTHRKRQLGGEIRRYDEEWYDLYATGGARISFQRVPDHRPPKWPQAESDSQQLHLDFTVTDMERAHEEVLAVGARTLDLDDRGGERGWRVYPAPAGYPFCLCQG